MCLPAGKEKNAILSVISRDCCAFAHCDAFFSTLSGKFKAIGAAVTPAAFSAQPTNIIMVVSD
ncbi:hypothetical protein AXW38_07925 [Yersinia ruckeri]|nr:hypothetical protein AXW19_07895 [Yersinia ruckeri]OIX37030.1 hypothetical protein AXW20_07915 [Yersinia ruckeri]OIX37483.1 hypothetical protein AXW18_07915 [Yersinia ruckeri]OIX47530.1 hypothetical protein AXW21_07930 [Yersinia ruckeri]OIX48330.1 hypothetical protein AXW23_07910 [Yersinia ruckeri]